MNDTECSHEWVWGKMTYPTEGVCKRCGAPVTASGDEGSVCVICGTWRPLDQMHYCDTCHALTASVPDEKEPK